MTAPEPLAPRASTDEAPQAPGDPSDLDELTPLVYAELRRLARTYLARSRGREALTLQTTELVHEAYLRLQQQDYVRWQNRGHVIGIAARMMRRILVDFARRRHAQRRGGFQVRVPLDEAPEPAVVAESDVVRLDELLNELALLDPRQARLAELRLFAGQGIEAVAQLLGVSPATVKREWRLVKAWLLRELKRGGGVGDRPG
jgi:RNA polymerase sigma-70 factor, ECF subfamily